jgi:hypothetical protein
VNVGNVSDNVSVDAIYSPVIADDIAEVTCDEV